MNRFRQNPAIAWRKIDKQSVLLDPGTGTVFVLNDLGARIWELLEETSDPAEVTQAVLEEVPGLPGRLQEDVDGFLASLVDRDLAVSTV